MAAGDSILDAEEVYKDESKRIPTHRTLRTKSSVDGISLSPPPSNTWSLVSIKDNPDCESGDDPSFLIFPPTNHENLHLDFKHHGRSLTLAFPSSSSLSSSSSSEIIDEDQSNGDSSTSTLCSPSTEADSPPRVPRGRKVVGAARWVNLGMEVLFSKVKWVLSYGSNRIPAKKSAFTAVAVVVGFLYLWRRGRGRRTEQISSDRVARIIKEKDERIDQLLNQIARMNDLLLALQRLPSSCKDVK